MSSPLSFKRKDAFSIGLGPALDDFMDERKIPVLAVPDSKPQEEPAPKPLEVAPPPVVQLHEVPQPRQKPQKVKTAPQIKVEPGSAKRTSITIYAPDYVSKALRKRAFEKDMTVTAYILHALALAKIPVREEDLLCDGRKSDPTGRVDIMKD